MTKGKKVIVAFMLSLAINFAMKAEVICEKGERGRWYPKNEKAIEIAKMLGVKTCSGERFQEVLTKLGEKSNVEKSTRKMNVDEIVSKFKGEIVKPTATVKK